VRLTVVALIVGEIVLVGGLGLAWLPAAPIALGGQLVAWALTYDASPQRHSKDDS